MRRIPTKPSTADKIITKFLWLLLLLPESGEMEVAIDVEGIGLEVEVYPKPSVTA